MHQISVNLQKVTMQHNGPCTKWASVQTGHKTLHWPRGTYMTKHDRYMTHWAVW